MRSSMRGLFVAGFLAVVAASVVVATPLRHRLAGAVPDRWIARWQQWRDGTRVDHDVRIAMPDGVRLAASLYRPPASAGERLPTVLVRVPYDRLAYPEGLWAATFFARHGYAVLVEDLRGKFASEGEFIPYRSGTADGAATLDWIASQPWSNGRVGSFGCSSLAETQFVLARARHPAHAAMIASGGGGGLGMLDGRASYGGFFEGGVFELASGFGWFAKHGAKRPDAAPAAPYDTAAILAQRPVASLVQRVRPGPNGYDAYLAAPFGDPFWNTLDYFGDGDRVEVPAFVVNTWGDQTLGDALALADHVRRTSPPAVAAAQRVVIAPGEHCAQEDVASSGRFGEIEVPNAAQPYRDWYLRWFDLWLRDRGNGLADLPPYRFYMIGEGRWLDAGRWPPEAARRERFFLSSGGHARSADGDGLLRPEPPAAAVPASGAAPTVAWDEYRDDPGVSPVPSRGGPICCTGNAADRAGPVDQRDVEARSDVLVYTSPPLAEPLRIAGPLVAHLVVSSSAPDADFIARLVHLRADGRAIGIQEGALRARYRKSLVEPLPLTPGVPVELAIDMRSIAWTLPAGDRLRLDISSRSLPRLEPNTNTGGDIHSERRADAATNRIHYDGGASSYVELWSLPVEAAAATR